MFLTTMENHVKTVGVYGGGLFLPIKYVQSPSMGVFASISLATAKTWDSIVKTFRWL